MPNQIQNKIYTCQKCQKKVSVAFYYFDDKDNKIILCNSCYYETKK